MIDLSKCGSVAKCQVVSTDTVVRIGAAERGVDLIGASGLSRDKKG